MHSKRQSFLGTTGIRQTACTWTIALLLVWVRSVQACPDAPSFSLTIEGDVKTCCSATLTADFGGPLIYDTLIKFEIMLPEHEPGTDPPSGNATYVTCGIVNRVNIIPSSPPASCGTSSVLWVAIPAQSESCSVRILGIEKTTTAPMKAKATIPDMDDDAPSDFYDCNDQNNPPIKYTYESPYKSSSQQELPFDVGSTKMTFDTQPLTRCNQVAASVDCSECTLTWSVIADGDSPAARQRAGAVDTPIPDPTDSKRCTIKLKEKPPSFKSGTVIIRATGAGSGCRIEEKLSVKGSGDGDNCPTCQLMMGAPWPKPKPGCVDVTLSLGKGSGGNSAGMLYIHQDAPLSPGSEWYDTLTIAPSQDVKLAPTGRLLPDNRVVRQIKVPEGLVETVPPDSSGTFQCFIYKTPGQDDGQGNYPNPGTPFRTWTFESSSGQDLTVTDSSTDTVYAFAYDDEQGGWSMSEGVSGKPLSQTASRFETASGETYEVKQGDTEGPTAYRKETDFETSGDRRVLEERVYVNDTDPPLTTTYSYSQNQMTVTQSDGNYVTTVHDQEGRISSQTRPTMNGETVSTHVTTNEYSYQPGACSDDDPAIYTSSPRIVTETVNGTPVSKTFYAYKTEGTTDVSIVAIEKESPTPGSASYADAANLVTETRSYPLAHLDEYLRGRTRSILYPNGRKDEYSYARGTWDPQTLQFDENTPTKPHLKTTIKHLANNGSSGAASITNRTTTDMTIADDQGRTLMSATYVHDGTEPGACVARTIHTYDEAADGTVTETSTRLNGTTETSVRHGCCGSHTETDANGTVTEYTSDTDASGNHVGITVKKGIGSQPDIVRTTTYDAMGRAVTQAVTGGATTHTTYDWSGRVLSMTDESGLVTYYSYELVTGGGRIEKVARPGDTIENPTEITEYYIDGRIKSVTGRGVVATYYAYGVNADGTQWTCMRTGKDTAAAPYVKTTRDALGRIITEEKPGAGSTTVITTSDYWTDGSQISGSDGKPWHSKGQLKSERITVSSALLIAPTVYEYDQLGNVFRTGLDLDDNGVLDTGLSDRINETESMYVLEGSDWWQVSVSRTYMTANSAAATPPATGEATPPTGRVLPWRNTERHRLTGFTSQSAESISVDLYGNPTITVVTIDPGPTAKEVTQTTTYPDSNVAAETITINGLLDSTTTKTGESISYHYDSLGREDYRTDERGITYTRYYDGAADPGSRYKIKETEDPAQLIVRYGYDVDTGRQVSITRLKGTTTLNAEQYSFDIHGRLERVWGSSTYPVQYGYDPDYGYRTSMTTYQGAYSGENWPGGTGNETTWSYYEATGLLKRKTYDDQTYVEHTYTADGKLQTRTSARGIVTTYTYWGEGSSEAKTGELHTVAYSTYNGLQTPPVTYEYSRLGQMQTVEDIVGTRAFAYDPDYLKLVSESIDAGTGGLYTKFIDRDAWSTGLPGQDAGFEIDDDYYAMYGYDTRGRLSNITGIGLAPWVGYVYGEDNTANAGRLVGREFRGSYGEVYAKAGYDYDPNRGAVSQVSNQFYPYSPTPSTFSQYDYGHDDLSRRKDVVNTGTVFPSGGAFNNWRYNSRSELTSSSRYSGDTPSDNPPPATEILDQRRAYIYDDIGNREHATTGGGTSASTLYYCRSQVNQYLETGSDASCSPPTESFTYDQDGNLLTSGFPAGPQLIAAKSIKTHGTAGDFGIDLPLASGQVGIEPRTGGPTTIEIEFSEEVSVTSDSVVLSEGTLGTVVQQAEPEKYRVSLSGVPDETCLIVTLRHIASKATGRELVGPNAVYVVALVGDVDSNGAVEQADLTAVQGQQGQPLSEYNFRCDLDASGVIDSADLTAVGTLDRSVSCPLPPAPLGFAYTWDGENRLVQVITLRDPADEFYPGDVRVEFKYDYLSRRVEKKTSIYTATSSGVDWSVEAKDWQRFVYDDWNPVLLLRGSDNAVLRKYTWGLDLSGSMHGAGGIGGLLAVYETNGTSTTADDHAYWFSYDANGNVGQVIDATDPNNVTIAAQYEYDPYGNTISQSGPYADVNPFRFSTRWYDGEMGKYSYIYRYYDPQWGRWISRDPIEEEGGLNLLAYVSNSPADLIDPLGLFFGGDHDKITSDAFPASGFKHSSYLGNVQRANSFTDLLHFFNMAYHAQSSSWLGLASGTYMSRIQTRECTNLFQTLTELEDIGITLHILQDFYTHTDWVDGEGMEKVYKLYKDPNLSRGHTPRGTEALAFNDNGVTVGDSVAYFSGGTCPLTRDLHWKYAADTSSSGRAKGNALGSRAYTRAKEGATNVSKSFRDWLGSHMTTSCYCKIFK